MNNVGIDQTYNGAIPVSGPMVLGGDVDIKFPNQTVLIDLKLQYATGKMSGVQTLYIDLSDYAGDVSVLMPDTRQVITAHGGTQGYYPVLSTNLMKFEATGTRAGQVKILFINFPIALGVWSKPDGGGSSGIQEIVAGANITVNNTDPERPVISATGGGGGSVVTVTADSDPSNPIQVDNSDPAKPVISAPPYPAAGTAFTPGYNVALNTNGGTTYLDADSTKLESHGLGGTSLFSTSRYITANSGKMFEVQRLRGLEAGNGITLRTTLDNNIQIDGHPVENAIDAGNYIGLVASYGVGAKDRKILALEAGNGISISKVSGNQRVKIEATGGGGKELSMMKVAGSFTLSGTGWNNIRFDNTGSVIEHEGDAFQTYLGNGFLRFVRGPSSARTRGFIIAELNMQPSDNSIYSGTYFGTHIKRVITGNSHYSAMNHIGIGGLPTDSGNKDFGCSHVTQFLIDGAAGTAVNLNFAFCSDYVATPVDIDYSVTLTFIPLE